MSFRQPIFTQYLSLFVEEVFLPLILFYFMLAYTWKQVKLRNLITLILVAFDFFFIFIFSFFLFSLPLE